MTRRPSPAASAGRGSGLCLEAQPTPKIIAALRQILSGEVFLSAPMTTKLLQCAAVGKPLDYNPTKALSNRELQVFG